MKKDNYEYKILYYLQIFLDLARNGQKFFYRGEGCALDDNGNPRGVTSGAFRNINYNKLPVSFLEYTENLLQDSYLLNAKELNCYGNWEKLSILQHRGAATPLIDFSANPLTALYFACSKYNGSDGKKAKDGVVYCYYATHCAEINTDTSLSDVFCSVTNINGRELYPVFLYNPPTVDNRISAQQGVFLVPSTGEIRADAYNAITITGEEKKQILEELARFGVSEYTLFYDLTGFCSNKRKDIRLHTIEKIVRQGMKFKYEARTKKNNEPEKVHLYKKASDSFKKASDALDNKDSDFKARIQVFSGDVLVESEEMSKAVAAYLSAIKTARDRYAVWQACESINGIIFDKKDEINPMDEYDREYKEYIDIIKVKEIENENLKLVKLLEYAPTGGEKNQMHDVFDFFEMIKQGCAKFR